MITLGRFISLLTSAIFLVAALAIYVEHGYNHFLLLMLFVAFVLYHYAEYLNNVRDKKKRNAREIEPCIPCHATGRLGRRKCHHCGGHGYITAPPDRGLPPIT